MPPRKTRDSLEHDRQVLLEALRDCEAGEMDHLDQPERDNVADRLKQRIADLEARIADAAGT